MKRCAATEDIANGMKRVRLTSMPMPQRPKRARSASPALPPRKHKRGGNRHEAGARAECAAVCAQRASAFARVGGEVDARRALVELQAETNERWRVNKALRRGLRRTYAENDRLRRDNAELLRRCGELQRTCAANDHLRRDNAELRRRADAAVKVSLELGRSLNQGEGRLAAMSACVQWVS